MKQLWWANSTAQGTQWNTEWLSSTNEYLTIISSTPPSLDHDTFSFPSKTGHPCNIAWWPDPALWDGEHKRRFLLCDKEFCMGSSSNEAHVWAPDSLLFVWAVWEESTVNRKERRAGLGQDCSWFKLIPQITFFEGHRSLKCLLSMICYVFSSTAVDIFRLGFHHILQFSRPGDDHNCWTIQCNGMG